ncbi:MAG: Gfo/Idh/MocA family oxidoreductase, partial [Alphaproteobacteria bacterium]
MPTNTRPLKAGIIGLGVGEAHLRSYQSIPDVEVTKICDIDPTRLAEIAKRYDVPGQTTDYRQVTQDPDI